MDFIMPTMLWTCSQTKHMPQENAVDDISESLSHSLYFTPLLVPRHSLTYPLPFSLSIPRAMFLSFGADSQLCRTWSGTPHLSHNTKVCASHPPTSELRNILGMSAHEILIVFLKQSRTRRCVAEQEVLVIELKSVLSLFIVF